LGTKIEVMMNHKVNCIHTDGYGFCNKKPKKLRLFKQRCVEYGQFTQSCDIADRLPRPMAPPTPPRPLGLPRNK
jgi:hypothetical protein